MARRLDHRYHGDEVFPGEGKDLLAGDFLGQAMRFFFMADVINNNGLYIYIYINIHSYTILG